MNNNADIHLDGELTCCPITFEFLAKDNESISIIWQYAKTITNPEISKHLERVLRIASDGLCNTCHDMKIDPSILDFYIPGEDYIVTPFEPETIE